MAIAKEPASPRESRIACALAPKLPLQLLRRTAPEGFRLPLAVIDRDDAAATILFADEQAMKLGIHPGLRYATAVTLSPGLHAAPVHPRQVEAAHRNIMRRLQEFSPGVEALEESPGAYYLDIRGMRHIAPDLAAWALDMQSDLSRHERLQINVATGYTRFGVLTAVRKETRPMSVTIFSSESQERHAALQTPLNRLVLPSRALREIEKLEVHTVKDLRRLPEAELGARFSEELLELARKSRDSRGDVHAAPASLPYRASAAFQPAQGDVEQLLTAILHLCRPLMHRMRRQFLGVRSIRLDITTDLGETAKESVRAASPTLDETALARVLRLRLDSLKLNHGVTSLDIRLIPAPLPDPQRALDAGFAETARKMDAANQALAQIRAEFGNESALRARCVDSHLPRESFAWEPFGRMRPPSLRDERGPCLIRRIHDLPKRVSTPRRATLKRVFGPYALSGYWWREIPARETHYYVETERGAALWLYYDDIARQWHEQGSVQ